jgi:amino acid permease
MVREDNSVEESRLNEGTTAQQPSTCGDHNEITAVSDENKKSAVEDEAQASDNNRTPRPWLHAAYHSVISVLGVGAMLALPYSYAYLGWAGGMILFVACTFTSFYSGQLLIECQDVTKHKTYSSLGDGIIGDGWSMRWVRPFQGIVFITVLIATVIAAGQFMIRIDIELDGNQNISNSSWYAVAGFMLLIISLAPNVDKSWTVSFLGTIATVVAVFMFLAGCGVSIGQVEDATYGRPVGDTRTEFSMGIMESFGILAFAYGGHSVIPDVHASLNHKDSEESKKEMMKAWWCSYYIIAPSYLLLLCLSYAAFGSTASAFVVDDFAQYVSQNVLWAIYAFSLVNFFAQGALYNQAAFTYIEDLIIILGPKCCGCTISEEEYNDGLFAGEGRKHWHKKLAIRVLYVGVGTFIGVALPFFGDLAALSGALGFTPCTFVYPFWIYNISPIGQKAPSWKRALNWLLALSFTGLGACAAVGALYNIVQNSSTYQFFS